MEGSALVVSIIGILFALYMPVILMIVTNVVNPEELMILEQLGFTLSGKSIYFSAFSPGNNFGIILPIFIIIIIFKDFI